MTSEAFDLLADAIARRVADRLAHDVRPRLVTAQELAVYLDVSPDWVYGNADLLRARRLGTGPRAPLRFSIADADRALLPPEPEPEPTTPSNSGGRRKSPAPTVPLLPIRGKPAHAQRQTTRPGKG